MQTTFSYDTNFKRFSLRMEVFCEIIVKKHGIYDIIKRYMRKCKKGEEYACELKKCSLNVEDAGKNLIF